TQLQRRPKDRLSAPMIARRPTRVSPQPRWRSLPCAQCGECRQHACDFVENAIGASKRRPTVPICDRPKIMSVGGRALCERVRIISGSSREVIGIDLVVSGTSGAVTGGDYPAGGSGGTVVARVARRGGQ